MLVNIKIACRLIKNRKVDKLYKFVKIQFFIFTQISYVSINLWPYSKTVKQHWIWSYIVYLVFC